MSNLSIFQTPDDLATKYGLSSGDFLLADSARYQSRLEQMNRNILRSTERGAQQYDSVSSSTGLFTERELTRVMSEVLQEVRAPLHGMDIAPVASDGLSAGVRHWVQYREQAHGQWRVFDGNSEDLGSTSISRHKMEGRVLPIVTSVRWNWFDQESASAAMLDLRGKLMRAANEVLMEGVNSLTFDSSLYPNLIGLDKLPFVDAPLLGSFGAGSTGPALCNAIQAVIDEQIETNKQAVNPNQCRMGLKLYNVIRVKPYDSQGGTETVLQKLQRDNPGITFGGFWELDSFDGGAGMVVQDTQRGCRTKLAQEPRMLPLQEVGLNYLIPIFIMFGGIESRQPMNVTIARYTNA